MKTDQIKRQTKLFFLILALGIHTAPCAENLTSNMKGDVVKEQVADEVAPLSADEVRQNRANEHRNSRAKHRSDRQERRRSRESAEQELIGGSMQEAVNDICLKYRSHPKTYATTYDAIATMNNSIAGPMNTIIENCDDTVKGSEIEPELVQSVLLELFKLSALEPDPEHYILRGFKICNLRSNSKEYSKKFDEVQAFHKAGNVNIANTMEGVVRACLDLASSRFYEHEVAAVNRHLKSYEKDKQTRLDSANKEVRALSRRTADRIKNQAEDRERYAAFATINEKIEACESYVQSKIDKVVASIKGENQQDLDSVSLGQGKLGKEIKIDYEGNRLVASTLYKTLLVRKKSCVDRFSPIRKRSDFVNAHQRPASHQNKTIKEILVLIEQEKEQNKLRVAEEEKLKRDTILTRDLYNAADDVCAKYKGDPNVYARVYNAIAEMDRLALVFMDDLIGYCEGRVLRSELNLETVKRVMYELDKPYLAELNTDFFILRGLDICERYKHDTDYSTMYDQVMASITSGSTLHTMKSMVESTCSDISKGSISNSSVQKIESLIYNYEKSKNRKSAP